MTLPVNWSARSDSSFKIRLLRTGSIMYEVREQVPLNVHEKHGKRRPKMDIEVERHRRGIRPCLGFEAKRLGRGETVGGYLGSEGLTAFLTGYYPTTHGEAGMLGYIQERTNDEWSAKLARELSLNATQ